MDTVKEVVTLVKFSLKRENLLEEIKENLEEPESAAKGGIFPTRCARVVSSKSNLAALRQELTISLSVDGLLDARQAKMNTFDFFFGLSLG